MDDLIDEEAIAEISAQIEESLAGHNFELVFDYTPYDEIVAPEGASIPEFYFPEFDTVSEAPVQFYFDEEGNPCTEYEELECDIVATIKPDKSKEDGSEKKVNNDNVVDQQSAMPSLDRVDAQDSHVYEEFNSIPSTSFANNVIETDTMYNSSIPQSTTFIKRQRKQRSKSLKQRNATYKRANRKFDASEIASVVENKVRSTFAPIKVHPAPSTSLESRKLQKVPHPGTLAVYESKLPSSRTAVSKARATLNQPQSAVNTTILSVGTRRPSMLDYIRARRMNPYGRP